MYECWICDNDLKKAIKKEKEKYILLAEVCKMLADIVKDIDLSKKSKDKRIKAFLTFEKQFLCLSKLRNRIECDKCGSINIIK